MRCRHTEESGYVAILVCVLAVVLFGMAAFTVDVGRWYVLAKQEQRAADAGALGGVPHLPGNPTAAFTRAKDLAKANTFTDGQNGVSVATELDGQPTRLRVTVTKTIRNVFGGLLGVPETTISRSATADYAGPVPLGSPCNSYGNDPENDTMKKSANCADTAQFWGNIGSPSAPKNNGDAFANDASGANPDYDPNGYIYTVEVKKPTANLAIDVFDPALIDVGDLCDENKQNHNFIKLQQASLLQPSTHTNPKAVVPDPGARYKPGADSPYCTGDISYTNLDKRFDGQVRTKYTVREHVPTSNSWDPLSYPVRPNCAGAKTYPGFSGDLSKTLDRTRDEYKVNTPEFGQGYVAQVFRRWVNICTVPYAAPGTYLLQITTNGLGADSAQGHNRFAVRAYSTTDGTVKDDVSVSGYNKMAMYANLPNATTTFFLARIPSGAQGHILNVRLFDVGDSTTPGEIRVLAPAESSVPFTNCSGSGPVSGVLPNCEITAQNSTHNGKWQVISVPVPAAFTCEDLDPQKCWVRLRYTYGAGNQPSDTTSWQASLEGDPVRLVR